MEWKGYKIYDFVKESYGGAYGGVCRVEGQIYAL